MNFIEKLQNKPKKTRILILWISSGFAMLVVVMFWACFFTGDNISRNAESDLEKTELPSLFESVKQDFLIFKEKIGESLKEIKTKTEEVEQSDEGQE